MNIVYTYNLLDANTFIQVIRFSVGLLASLITVMSYGDDLAKLGTMIISVSLMSHKTIISLIQRLWKIVQSGSHGQHIQQEGICRRFVESRELAVSWKV